MNDEVIRQDIHINQDAYGVFYFENVKASILSDAKIQVQQRLPDVKIRAVTMVLDNNEDEQV
ncbi:hypothetical protein GC093_04550 [Paenibacillus sp. LMG 31456]|uniref:Uncharacterized protein n=1 Tax=Paenibacillus foliorum TaxID=2654974 RepID=A0A972GQG0_9BACL|nr:hypothetical protein [Paenibacillus foliorum]NOU92504.1 hypothetical protein [Paenibacillus foliorum]